MTDTLANRFWANVSRAGEDECWPWLGANAGEGYGGFQIDGRTNRATHLALILSDRPRPSSRHLACHSCDNPPCVNPAHLWWGTFAENARDMSRKGRVVNQFGNQNKTHCVNGHEYTPENTVPRPTGRNCRTCSRACWRKYNAKRPKRLRRRALGGGQ